MSSIVFVTPGLQNITFKSSFPTGTSNPRLARNLDRAHAWSQDESSNTVYLQPMLPMTSLQSNMARARAFRLQ